MPFERTTYKQNEHERNEHVIDIFTSEDIENITWVRGNTNFISSVEYDIIFNTRNKFDEIYEISFSTREVNFIFPEASMYFSVYYIKGECFQQQGHRILYLFTNFTTIKKK